MSEEKDSVKHGGMGEASVLVKHGGTLVVSRA